MKIHYIFVEDRDLSHLLERVYDRAQSLGIDKVEAVRQALRDWLAHSGQPQQQPGDRVLEATPAEYEALTRVLAAMRRYDADPDAR